MNYFQGKFINRYRVIKKLNSEWNEHVWLVDDLGSNRKLLKSVDSSIYEEISEEIANLKKLNNQFIIQFYDAFKEYGFNYIVTEYQPQNLADVIELHIFNRTEIETSTIEFWAKQIIQGLLFLHQNRIIHRGIFPKNILVTENDDLKIGDIIGPIEFYSDETIAYIKNYACPELLIGIDYDEKVDIWGYGCVLYEMIFLDRLFKNDYRCHQLNDLIDIYIPSTQNNTFYRILRKCVKKNPSERANALEITNILIVEFGDSLVNVNSFSEKDPFIDELFDNGRYKIESFLGSGNFGRVYLANDNTFSSKKAIKIINALDVNANDVMEINTLKRIKNEFIVEYQGYFKNQYFLFIVIEYIQNGDLSKCIEKHVNSNVKIEPERIFLWSIQTAEGLKFLHSNRIIHRDIKPENLFLTHEDKIKIGDLGLAKMSRSSISKSNESKGFAGTENYMSPEMFAENPYSYKTDIWSLGCVVFELLYLKKAFSSFRVERKTENIAFEKSILTFIPKKMLITNPNERPSSHDLSIFLKAKHRELFEGES